MKTSKKLNSNNIPAVQIDHTLNQYKDKVLFPEKLAKANALLKNAKLPNRDQQI